MPNVKEAPELIYTTPVEVRIVDFEFDGDDLGSGETLSTIGTPDVSPAGELTAGSETVSGTRAQVTIQGGVAGKRYRVTAEVTTSAGQTLRGSGIVVCDDA